MKKIILGFLGIVMIFSLAGCSGRTRQVGGADQFNQQNSQSFFNRDPSSLSIQQKMGIGILKLEGTDLAVSADQAKTLLPLWQAIKTLSSDTNTTAVEIDALNEQIKEAMTDQQIQAIEKMSWTSDDLRQMMQQPGGTQAGGQVSSTETSSSRRRNGGFPAGGPGGPPEGFGGMMGQGGNGFQNPAAARTAVPGQEERRAAAGMNLMFADQVIRLLESKIKN